MFILGYTCTDLYYCENRGPEVTGSETVVRETCASDETCTGYDYAFGIGEYGHTCSQAIYPGSNMNVGYKLCQQNGNPGKCHF